MYAADTVGASGPGWTDPASTGIDPPAGEKDMGGWFMNVYTDEQHARLRVDETGEAAAPSQPQGFGFAAAPEDAAPAPGGFGLPSM